MHKVPSGFAITLEVEDGLIVTFGLSDTDALQVAQTIAESVLGIHHTQLGAKQSAKGEPS